jgi:NADH-quinone oxidoreductase subunit C
MPNTTALPAEEKLLPMVRALLGAKVLDTHCLHGEETIFVAPKDIADAMKALRDDPELDFEILMDLCGVDYQPRRPRFEVVYHLCSTRKRHRLRVRVQVEAKDPTVPTLRDLWPGADWYEREVWDMFGIRFEGNPDQRRLFMWEEFEGHPLRKDYPKEKRQPLIRREGMV